MILADTSVWIDYLKGIESPQTNLLDKSIESGDIVMGDLILLEVLQGIRDDRQFKSVKDSLSAFETCSMLNPESAVAVANNYRLLRKKGLTIRKTNDVIIASYCIAEELPLLFQDRDFKPFIQYLGLQAAYSEV